MRDGASYQTCHRRFKAWHDSGVLARVMQQLFGGASEGLYSLMTSRMRVPVELPAGLGDHVADPVTGASVNGDARVVFVPIVQAPNPAPADYTDGARRAA